MISLQKLCFKIPVSVMDHKYKALLHNVKARHIITEIENTEQIIKLRNLDFNNFFILGKLESVKHVLGTEFRLNISPSFILCRSV